MFSFINLSSLSKEGSSPTVLFFIKLVHNLFFFLRIQYVHPETAIVTWMHFTMWFKSSCTVVYMLTGDGFCTFWSFVLQYIKEGLVEPPWFIFNAVTLYDSGLIHVIFLFQFDNAESTQSPTKVMFGSFFNTRPVYYCYIQGILKGPLLTFPNSFLVVHPFCSDCKTVWFPFFLLFKNKSMLPSWNVFYFLPRNWNATHGTHRPCCTLVMT